MTKFKPRSGEKEVISFRIPKDLLSELDLLSVQQKVSRNELMLQCIEYALANIDENIRKNP